MDTISKGSTFQEFKEQEEREPIPNFTSFSKEINSGPGPVGKKAS